MSYDLLGYIFFGLYWVVFVYSIVLHEIAHGYSSYLMGDPTAWKAGRLTLNPLKHVDPLFSIVMPIIFFLGTGIPFGGAKPVPVNPLLYRNVRWGSLKSAAAGPLTNLALALVFTLLFLLFRSMSRGTPTPTTCFLAICITLNVFLAVFNFMPIPPLDGSHVLGALLPRDLQEPWGRLQSLGWLPLIILVIVNNRVWPIISLPVWTLTSLLLRLMGAGDALGEGGGIGPGIFLPRPGE